MWRGAGRISDGKLGLADRASLDQWLASHAGIVEVVILPAPPRRTLDQNRYYFGLLVRAIAAETGDDEVSVHEQLATKFLEPGPDGTRRSTATLDTLQFATFNEHVAAWASTWLGLTWE